MQIIPRPFYVMALCCVVLSASCRERTSDPSARAAPRFSERGSLIPASRGGEDMLGKRLPLAGLKWLNTPGAEPIDVTGRVTLVRWWTDSCPFCEASLPAIEDLTRRYGPAGFQAIGVYHPKPPRHVEAAEVLRSAKALGFSGPVASDLDWATLDQLYLSTGNRPATSVSFLLDREGVIRYVHPGPEFHPTDDPAMAEINRDYEDIRLAIDMLLSEKIN